MLKVKVPPAVGIPDSEAVPSPLSVKLIPAGRVPVWVMVVELGRPGDVVIEKLAAAPTVNVAWLVLVITGGWFTVRVKVCVASGAIPLLAVSVRV